MLFSYLKVPGFPFLSYNGYLDLSGKIRRLLYLYDVYRTITQSDAVCAQALPNTDTEDTLVD